jgi:hypothetical protein
MGALQKRAAGHKQGYECNNDDQKPHLFALLLEIDGHMMRRPKEADEQEDPQKVGEESHEALLLTEQRQFDIVLLRIDGDCPRFFGMQGIG